MQAQLQVNGLLKKFSCDKSVQTEPERWSYTAPLNRDGSNSGEIGQHSTVIESSVTMRTHSAPTTRFVDLTPPGDLLGADSPSHPKFNISTTPHQQSSTTSGSPTPDQQSHICVSQIGPSAHHPEPSFPASTSNHAVEESANTPSSLRTRAIIPNALGISGESLPCQPSPYSQVLFTGQNISALSPGSNISSLPPGYGTFSTTGVQYQDFPRTMTGFKSQVREGIVTPVPQRPWPRQVGLIATPDPLQQIPGDSPPAQCPKSSSSYRSVGGKSQLIPISKSVAWRQQSQHARSPLSQESQLPWTSPPTEQLARHNRSRMSASAPGHLVSQHTSRFLNSAKPQSRPSAQPWAQRESQPVQVQSQVRKPVGGSAPKQDNTSSTLPIPSPSTTIHEDGSSYPNGQDQGQGQNSRSSPLFHQKQPSQQRHTTPRSQPDPSPNSNNPEQPIALENGGFNDQISQKRRLPRTETQELTSRVEQATLEQQSDPRNTYNYSGL